MKNAPRNTNFPTELCLPFAKACAHKKLEELEAKQGLIGSKESYLQKEESILMEALSDSFQKQDAFYEKARLIVLEKMQLLPMAEKNRIQEEMANHAHLDTLLLQKIWDKDIEGIIDASKAKFSQETLVWFYTLGYELFEKKQYEDALPLFFLLTRVDPLCSDYWTALALTKRNLHQAEDALYDFAMASLLNPESPSPRYNAAEIYLELHQIDDAKAEYEALAEIVKNLKLTDFQPLLESLKTRIQS